MRFRKDAKLDPSRVESYRGRRPEGGVPGGMGGMPVGGGGLIALVAFLFLGGGSALSTGFVEDITRQDVADAPDAAAAVGDDRIQEPTQGRVTPESWSHGSSERRRSWFVRGIEGSGSQSCDTFRGRV